MRPWKTHQLFVASQRLARAVRRTQRPSLEADERVRTGPQARPNQASPGRRESSEIEDLRVLAQGAEWGTLERDGLTFLEARPDDAEALTLVAYSLQQLSRPEEAQVLARRAASLTPSIWMPNFIAGVTLNSINEPETAVEYLRAALASWPSDRDSLKHLTRAVAAAQGLEQAATEYDSGSRLGCAGPKSVVASLSSVPDWAELTGHPLMPLGEAEHIPYRAPVVFGSSEPSELEFRLSNRPYVAEVHGARIFSGSDIVLAPDGTALSDAGTHPQFGRYLSYAFDSAVLAQRDGRVLLGLDQFVDRELDSAIHLSGCATDAFGHWLPDFLARLQFFQQHPDFERLPILVDANMPASHIDHLQRLAPNPLVYLLPGESLTVRRLVVAPSPAFFPVELLPNDLPPSEMPGLSPSALRFLRGQPVTEGRRQLERRIFLARRNTRWRRLTNENEISDDLARLDFEPVFLEDLPMHEQIELFRSSDWIVAPNGSALLNLVFAEPTVKVVILSQPNLFNWGTLQGPMEDLGYRLLFVCGEWAVSTREKHSDYIVRKEVVREALVSLGMRMPISKKTSTAGT